MTYELKKLMAGATGFHLVDSWSVCEGEQKTFAFENKKYAEIKLRVCRPYYEDIVEPAELQNATEQDLQTQMVEWQSEVCNGAWKNVNVKDLPELIREIAVELISREFDLASLELKSGIVLNFVRVQGRNGRLATYVIEWRPSKDVVKSILSRWVAEDVGVEFMTLHADGITVERLLPE